MLPAQALEIQQTEKMNTRLLVRGQRLEPDVIVLAAQVAQAFLPILTILAQVQDMRTP